MALYRGATKLAGIGIGFNPENSGTTGQVLTKTATGYNYQDIVKSYTTIQVTLLANGWSSNEQTVTATGVTTTNSVVVSPDPSSFSDYTDAVIYCSSQASGSLTFTCDTEPTNDIVVNIMIFN